MQSAKRILFYVHFNKNNQLSEYVPQQLLGIKPLFHKIFFISNSVILDDDKKRLSGLYDDFIQRDNIGFDFAAWRDGIKKIGWKELTKYDSVTMMNDTCFGPIHAMSTTYEKMEPSNADFWGLTNHGATRVGAAKTGKFIPEHLQSYFICYSNNVIKSKTFRLFWENVKDYKDVSQVIMNYETRITEVLVKDGFVYDAYFDAQEYSAKHHVTDVMNFSELCPLVMINAKMPLIKIKAFTHLPYNQIIKAIKKTSNYSIDLIHEHIKTMKIPTVNKATFVLIRFKTRLSSSLKNNKTIKGIARRHPKMIKFIKKISKRVFGDHTVYMYKPDAEHLKSSSNDN